MSELKLKYLITVIEMAISVQKVLQTEYTKASGENDPYIRGIITGLNAALEQVRLLDAGETEQKESDL